MKTGIISLPAFAAAGVLCLGLGFVPASAQTKPAESTTKVKKVLLYNKIGGWVHVDGSADVKTVMTRLAAGKGFQLTQLADDGSITLDYLKQFNVIVWNNNTNGATSVPSASARTAIMSYVNQGGGWFLIHGAGDHANSWNELTTTLGTSFTRHGNQGAAEAVIDAAAKSHKELKYMVETIPATIRLTDEWYSFQSTVRPLANVTVVATARPVAGVNNVIVPIADGSNDLTYIWARTVGTGRMLYSAIGHGQNQLMAQVDSVVPKMYWEHLRYAAGDYKNGCTTKGDSKYDSTARVHVAAECAGGTGVEAGTVHQGITVSRGALKIQVPFSHSGSLTIRARDIRGSLVWERSLPAGTAEVSLDNALESGMYNLEFRNGANVAHRRVMLP